MPVQYPICHLAATHNIQNIVIVSGECWAGLRLGRAAEVWWGPGVLPPPPQHNNTTTLRSSLVLSSAWRRVERGKVWRALVTGLHLTCSCALSACPASLCLPGAGASSSLCSCSWSSRGWAWQLSSWGWVWLVPSCSWGWVWPPLSRRSASPLPRPLGAGLGTLGGASLLLGEAWLWKLGESLTNTSAWYSEEMEKVLILELQTIHRFSQSRGRPLLGPSPG